MMERVRETVIIIPTYNNAKTLGQVIIGVRSYGMPVWVINDGSTDTTSDVLDSFPDVHVITHAKNRGKGVALQTGLSAAMEAGFRYAITIDSDGQHYPDDIPVFLQAIAMSPDSLLIGARNLTSDNMPGKNTFANKFSNFWFRLETGVKMTDTQSGFRLYPLHKLKGLRLFTSKYEFELEIIVRAVWRGVSVNNIPVKVYYPPEGERVSHFRPLRDFTRISLLNSVLVMIALLWYWPVHFFRSCTRENIKRLISEHITNSGESNGRIACAVMFGVFMGIVPLWGYQMLTAVALAHVFRLNKVIVLVCSNVSIPPMIPFILFGSYAIGGWMLNQPLVLSFHDLNWEVLKDSLLQYLLGSFVLAGLCAVLVGIISITLLSLFRKRQSVVS